MNALIFVPGISGVCFRQGTLPKSVLIREEQEPDFSNDFVTGCYSRAARELGELPGPSEISMMTQRLTDSPADRLLATHATEIDEPSQTSRYDTEKPENTKGVAATIFAAGVHLSSAGKGPHLLRPPAALSVRVLQLGTLCVAEL